MIDERVLNAFPWWEIRTRNDGGVRSYVVSVLPRRRAKTIRVSDTDLERAIQEAAAQAFSNVR